ncbi:MAG TPA: hypothetical protein VF131_14045 [Blastocatellia bacterium]|nr:hypothetical protein [Blastocatellia bacterium]
MKHLATLLIALVGMIMPLQFEAASAGSFRGHPEENTLGPVTKLIMHSELGDYVGNSQDYLYTPANGVFSTRAFDSTGDGVVDNVQIAFQQPGGTEFWFLNFGADKLNRNLTPGFYHNAERTPFARFGRPGLDVGGNGRGCNAVTGKFIVLDASFDYSGSSPSIRSFAARFEQHCEGGPKSLFGEIYINYTPTASIALDRSEAVGGQEVVATISLNAAAPTGGAKVRLSSSNSGLASGPLSIQIPEGTTSTTFRIATRAMKARPSVDIVATYQGVSSVATLNVMPSWQPRYSLSLHRSKSNSGSEFDRTFTQQDGQFFAVTSFSPDDVPNFFIITFSGTENWNLFFSTAQLGIPMQPGSYPKALRASFAPPGHPGLDISGNGSGCNELMGKFTVFETVVDHTFTPAQVVSFSGKFKQFCENRPPALTGSIFFNSSEEPSGPALGFCIQDSAKRSSLLVDTATGDYLLVRCGPDGFTLSGTGILTITGKKFTLEDTGPDRIVAASFNRGKNTGTASVQLLSPFSSAVTISDENTKDNTCSCQ